MKIKIKNGIVLDMVGVPERKDILIENDKIIQIEKKMCIRDSYYIYGLGIIGILVLIYVSNYFQYNATFFSTYIESGKEEYH